MKQGSSPDGIVRDQNRRREGPFLRREKIAATLRISSKLHEDSETRPP